MKLSVARIVSKNTGKCVAVISLSTLLLTACSVEQSSQSSPSPVESEASTPTSISTPTKPAVSEEITAESGAAKISCETLVPSQDLYNLNSNLALISDVYLGLTNETLKIKNLGGTGCQITNLSTASDVELVAVKLTSNSSIAVQNDLQKDASRTAIQLNNGVVGYFSRSGDIGQTAIVYNNYWVVLASKGFTDAGESSTFASLAIKGLPTN